MLNIYFALTSAEWGIARFTTDTIAITSLAILVGLPWLLLKERIGARNPWTNGNALSKR